MRTRPLLGVLAAALMFLPVQASFAKATGPSLSATTNHPRMSTFAPGQAVTLTFTAAGLPEHVKNLTLKLRIVDIYSKLIADRSVTVQPDAKGHWRGQVAAPHGRLGFYRVFATLSDGVKLSAEGSRPAGYLTYAVVPDPAKRRYVSQKDSRFSMPRNIDGIPWLGGNWILTGGNAFYAWEHLEPKEPGQFARRRAAAHARGKTDFPSMFDKVFKKPYVEKNGKKVPWPVYPIAWLYRPPPWAVIPQTHAYVTGALNTRGKSAWRAYAQEAAKSFSQQYPHLPEHVYQITWEPNYPWGFKGTDKQLIEIYKIVYPAIHAVDDKAVVLGPTGGSIGTHLDWNLRLLREGLGKYVDGWSIHPYCGLPPERHGLVEDIRTLRAAVHHYAGKHVQIWGLEQGAQALGPKPELQRTQGLIREHLIDIGEGFRMNYAFIIIDYGKPGKGDYGYYYNLKPSPRSWHPAALAPKPIAPAYAAMTDLINGYTSAGAIEWLGKTTLGYAFQRKNNIVLALWDYGQKPRSVTIPTGVAQVRVFDMMGNARTVATKNHTLTLTLTRSPQYVQGVSPKLWGRGGHKALRILEPQASGFSGGKVTLHVSVNNIGPQQAQFALHIETGRAMVVKTPRRTMTLKASQSHRVSIAVAIPATTPMGSYPVKLTLQRDGRQVAVTGMLLTVKPPVKVISVWPTRASGAKALRVTLASQQPAALHGTLRLRLRGVPGSRRRIDWQVAAQGQTQPIVPYAHLQVPPTRIWQAQVSVTTAGNYRSNWSFPVDFLTAFPVASPPIIDGRLNDWPAAPTANLHGRGQIVRSPRFYSGSKDERAHVWFAWDNSALYFACRVWDDAFVQPYTGNAIWEGDSIQLGIDPAYTRAGPEKSGNTLADMANATEPTEIGLALTSKGPQAYRWQGPKPQTRSGPLDAQQLTFAVTRQSNGLIYEARIPWRLLGVPNMATTHQHVIGVYLTINDRDSKDQSDPSALGLFVPNHNPAGKQIGDLLLAAPSPTREPGK